MSRNLKLRNCFWNVPLIFSDHKWPHVNETAESKTVVMKGLLYTNFSSSLLNPLKSGSHLKQLSSGHKRLPNATVKGQLSVRLPDCITRLDTSEQLLFLETLYLWLWQRHFLQGISSFVATPNPLFKQLWAPLPISLTWDFFRTMLFVLFILILYRFSGEEIKRYTPALCQHLHSSYFPYTLNNPGDYWWGNRSPQTLSNLTKLQLLVKDSRIQPQMTF